MIRAGIPSAERLRSQSGGINFAGALTAAPSGLSNCASAADGSSALQRRTADIGAQNAELEHAGRN
jgi:hypothetical protein